MELLSQSAPLLDTWKVAGLRGSLSIPLEWINEAKVCSLLIVVARFKEIRTRQMIRQRTLYTMETYTWLTSCSQKRKSIARRMN